MNKQTAGENELDNWSSLRRKIHNHWPEIGDSELRDVKGDSRRLVAIIHQRTGGTLSEIEEKIDKIAQESEGLLSRISGTAGDYAYSAKEGLAGGSKYVSDKVGDCVESTGQLMRDGYQGAVDYSSQGYQGTRSAIQSNPLQAAAIAFGTGAVVGYALLSSMLIPPPKPTYRAKLEDWWNR